MKHLRSSLSLISLLCTCCVLFFGCSKDNPTSPILKPQITSFTATPDSIHLGDSVVLAWKVDNAPSSVVIDNGVGTVTALSFVAVHPLATTKYVLMATNPEGSDTSVVTVTVKTPQGPTDVAANSQSATAIGVAWHRQPDDHAADTVVVMLNGGVVKSQVTSSTDSNAIIDGLTINTLYTIWVASEEARSSTSVRWATAYLTQSIRLYETNDGNAGEYSGLVLNGADLGQGVHAVAVSVSANSSNRYYSDIVLASDPSNFTSGLTIVSPAVTSLSKLDAGKYSKFSNSLLVPGGMRNVYYTGDLRTTIATTGSNVVNAVEIPVTTSTPLVFNTLTADNHFARVEVLPQSDGRLYGGTTDHRYIDVDVLYQPMANQPYASRALPLIRNVVPIRWRAE